MNIQEAAITLVFQVVIGLYPPVILVGVVQRTTIHIRPRRLQICPQSHGLHTKGAIQHLLVDIVILMIHVSYQLA